MLVMPWSTMGCAGVAGMRVWTLQGGSTALIRAARYGRVEAVALLLDRGADLEAKNKVKLQRLLSLPCSSSAADMLAQYH